MLDRIFIKDLVIPCFIGIYNHEKEHKQNIMINVSFWVDTTKVTSTNNIEDTLDYDLLKKDIEMYITNKHFKLIETLSNEIASLCLTFPIVEKVKVRLEKLEVFQNAKSAGIEIIRQRK